MIYLLFLLLNTLQESNFCVYYRAMAPRKANVMLNANVEFIHNKKAIGRGKVVKVSNLDVLHGSRLPKGCYGVAVNNIYEGKDAPLPHPVPMEDDITSLKAALNTIVAWPKDDLVIFCLSKVFKNVNNLIT